MHSQKEIEPSKKTYLLTYALFYAFGVVTTVPSNFFTTANDYWMYKFRNLDSNETYNNANKTGMQAEFTADYSIVSNVSYVVFVVFVIRVLRTKISLFQRTIGCLSGAVALLILTCIFVQADTDSWQRGFFVITLIVGFFLTGLCAAFMVTLFEMAVRFPTSFVPTIFSGQAICGIFAALVQILALGVGGGPKTTGLIYFLIGMLFIFFTLVAFLASWMRNGYFKFYILKEIAAQKKLEFSKETILSALNKTKFYMMSMVIVLGSTIMLHPGVITLVESIDKNNGNKWNGTFFGPVVNFLLYYIFDYLGRELAIIIQKPTNSLILLTASCVRTALVPLILFCNAQPRSHLDVVFQSDAVYIIFVILFALSGGYVVNLSISRVPKVTDEKERPFAMIAILLLMILSLAICSVTSTAIVKAL